MDLNLCDKVILISGGSRGIGSAICEGFVKEKCRVYFTYKSNEEAATNTVNRIKDKYPEGFIISIKADVTNQDECKRIVDEIYDKEGKIDVLVNNAGITNDGLMLMQSNEEWQSVLNVSIGGTYNLIREVGSKMFYNRKGSIINISSVAGIIGVIGQTNYCTAKSAVIGMTRALSKEFGIRNIRVNAIAPGYIETDMTKNLKNIDSLKKTIPLKRLGDVEEVANLAVFLASENSAYINGETIVIDGGLTYHKRR